MTFKVSQRSVETLFGWGVKRFLQQIFTGNYVPNFLRITWVLQKILQKHFGLFFPRHNVESSLSLFGYTFRIFKSSSYIKVIGSRSRSQEQKSVKSHPHSLCDKWHSLAANVVTASPFQSFRALTLRACSHAWRRGQACANRIFAPYTIRGWSALD